MPSERLQCNTIEKNPTETSWKMQTLQGCCSHFGDRLENFEIKRAFPSNRQKRKNKKKKKKKKKKKTRLRSLTATKGPTPRRFHANHSTTAWFDPNGAEQ
jgi:hypothetical protein